MSGAVRHLIMKSVAHLHNYDKKLINSALTSAVTKINKIRHKSVEAKSNTPKIILSFKSIFMSNYAKGTVRI